MGKRIGGGMFDEHAQTRQDNLNRALGDNLRRRKIMGSQRRTVGVSEQPARGRRGSQARRPRVRRFD